MKRLLHIILLASVFLVSACAVTNQQIQTQATTKSHHNELVSTSSFKIVKGGWFNIAKFESQMADKKETLRGMNAPSDVLAQFDATLPRTRPLEIMMGREIRKQNFAFYVLGFFIKDGVDINISQKAFHFRFLTPDSSIVETDDLGCLAVYYEGNVGKPYDSRQSTIVFNRQFNNKPDYNKRPNAVYVRLPKKYSQYQLIGLDIDPTRIGIVGTLAAKTP
ncbi:hypothetical protein KKH39_03515 [Patescibacteria group bacterium]|nr:hypothetical protein [Patescibacteria group bacterium]